jgi:hypothetical protein
MEELPLRPLRRLKFKLRGCLPLVDGFDALEERTFETELTDLILLLARPLHDPDLPIIHIRSRVVRKRTSVKPSNKMRYAHWYV